MNHVRPAGRLSASLIALSLSQISLAEPAPVIGPPAPWVREGQVPPPNPANKDLPLQVLLSSLQERFGQDSTEAYVHTVAVPQNTAGLQAIGNVTIPWNSERTDLTIHQVTIRRGQQVIDLLKSQEFIVLRRENNLENSTLDGVRTVSMQAAGLEVGDQLEVAFTYKDRPGTIGTKPESINAIVSPMPFGLMERRFLIADGAKIEWRADPSLGEMKPTKKGGYTELSYVQQNFVPTKWADNVPDRYRLPGIQLTSYASWNDVVQVMRPLFNKARTPVAGSPLPAMADEIGKVHSTPEARMMAALRLTQEKVRYVALQLGESAFIPATADQTWVRRFGDCKGKTAMLLALLDRLGIEAVPLLTSTEASSLIGSRLPSLYTFNHVVVRARINGRDYLLDPTAYGQRTLEELSYPDYEWGLPLVDQAQLWRVPKAAPTRPLTETVIDWDASKGFDQKVPFTATLTYRGSSASFLRALQAAAPDRAELDKYLEAQVPAIADEALELQAIEPDGKDGEYVVRLKGTAAMDWSRNIAGRQYYFDHSVPMWKPEFARDDGPSKELPVVLPSPTWIRSTETVTLPLNGSGFTLKAQPISTTIAGTEIRRSGKIEGARATVTAEFRRISPEITAQEARAAQSALKRISADYAYAVAPKDYVVSRAEVKAIISQDAEGYGQYLERARLLMDQGDRTRALGELDKAIAADASQAEAPALKAVNYFFLERYEEGRKSMAQAVKMDPDDPDSLRAQALFAWHDRDSALALKAINRAIEIDPEYHGLFAIRAQIRAGLGQYDGALVDVRRAVDLSADTMSPGSIAQYEAASGRIDQALATVEKAIASGRKDDAFLLVQKGDLLALQGKATEAKAAYRQAKDDLRAEMDRRFKAETGGVPASSDLELQLLIMSRNYDEAEPLADRKIANQRYPSAANLGRRAMVRVMNGKYEVALADARNALSLDPSDETARNALILGLLRTGKFSDADRQATSGLAKHPSEAFLYYARAIARAKLGNAAGAAADLQAARQLRFDVMLEPAFRGLNAE